MIAIVGRRADLREVDAVDGALDVEACDSGRIFRPSQIDLTGRYLRGGQARWRVGYHVYFDRIGEVWVACVARRADAIVPRPDAWRRIGVLSVAY